MNLSEVTDILLAAKSAKGLSFTDLEKVLERDEVWIAAVFLPAGQRVSRRGQEIGGSVGT